MSEVSCQFEGHFFILFYIYYPTSSCVIGLSKSLKSRDGGVDQRQQQQQHRELSCCCYISSSNSLCSSIIGKVEKNISCSVVVVVVLFPSTADDVESFFSGFMSSIAAIATDCADENEFKVAVESLPAFRLLLKREGVRAT